MSQTRRLSRSYSGTWKEPSFDMINPPELAAEGWSNHWKSVYARDLISDSRIVSVDADTSVEDACEMLLSENITCLAVKARLPEHNGLEHYSGLFDFSDVNAFLTLAATRHTLGPDDLRYNSRLDSIVTAARAGRVPVHLVSNLSEKNPLEVLPYESTIISLLEVFSRGTHTVLIRSSVVSEPFLGMISDRHLLSWLYVYAKETTTLRDYLSNALQALCLPSLNLYTSVVAATSNSSVLDAMKLMSEEGVSSIAVLDNETGLLISAVSVTDIGKIVVPSQSNQILSAPLHFLISQIKEPDGSTDGVDKYPVYSVFPSSTLLYTIEKLLATNAHRVFVTHESEPASPLASANSLGNLCGIVSIVDILSIFARSAKIPNVDPTRMQRHRRASSSSSQSSKSERELFIRSRSSSRTSIRQSPGVLASPLLVASSPPGPSIPDKSSIASKDISSIKRRESLGSSRKET